MILSSLFRPATARLDILFTSRGRLMSFLDWPIEYCQSGGRAGDTRRRKSASHLISLFARAFPQITYRLIWDSPLINAQAWRLGEGRNRLIDGGTVCIRSLQGLDWPLRLLTRPAITWAGSPVIQT